MALVCTAISTSISQSVNRPEGKLYADAEVHSIYLTMPADSVAWLFAPGNEWNNEHIRATFVHTYAGNADTVQQVGVRLRGNTSRTAGKKSIKISFNTFAKGRTYDGVEKINLNGQHNDPTVTRAHLSQRILYQLNAPTLLSSHTRLYINGDYMGLYLNTEHIDEEYVEARYGNNDGNLYKCTYPADLLYQGQNPDLYKNENAERPPYELITNKEKNDYSDLAHFIDILNNTPADELPCALEPIFHVSEYLRYAAFDVLVGNWDGPIFNKNNFYLYQNTATGKFEYIPFDLDNTFGIDWFGENWAIRNVYQWSLPDRPIYERLMAVPEYRDLYSYHMDEMLDEVFNNEWIGSFLDEKQAQLAPHIAADDYYSRSYGFDIDDFNTSFAEGVGSNHARVGVKEYTNTRYLKAKNQLIINDIAPVITAVHTTIDPAAQTLTVYADVWDDRGLSDVRIFYKATGAAEFTSTAMIADDYGYTATIPAPAQATVEYYLLAEDTQDHSKTSPRCGTYQTSLQLSDLKIAINELQASNSSTIADEVGEYDDWLELYNYDSKALNLEGLFLTDNTQRIDKWTLPAAVIEPSEYLLVWLDNDEDQGPLHANFRLSAAGEYIGLYDQDSMLIDGTSFGTQIEDSAYGRIPDGNGPWQTTQPTPGGSNMPVSVSDQEENSIKIYPNPASQSINILHPNMEALVEVYDMQGRLVASNKSTNANIIAIDQLPKGYYLVNVSNNNQLLYQQKIVKL